MSDFECLPIGTKARLERAEHDLELLVGHLNEHITYARDRVQDGTECGAIAWRLALEDIARENVALLDKIGRPRRLLPAVEKTAWPRSVPPSPLRMP